MFNILPWLFVLILVHSFVSVYFAWRSEHSLTKACINKDLSRLEVSFVKFYILNSNKSTRLNFLLFSRKHTFGGKLRFFNNYYIIKAF